MKSRKGITRREKAIILKAVKKHSGEDAEIEVETERRTYRIKIENGVAILPSGKAFEVDARHIC